MFKSDYVFTSDLVDNNITLLGTSKTFHLKKRQIFKCALMEKTIHIARGDRHVYLL